MKKIFCITLILLIGLYFKISYQAWYHSDYFRLIVFDVGQGDSIFIITPKGQTILIDGGPDASVLRCLGKVMPMWVRHIDLLILTHTHDDHVGGLIELVNRYEVNKILIGGSNYSSPVSKIWRDMLSEENNVLIAEEGDVFNFGEDCSLKVLSSLNGLVKDENDYSIVSLFSCLGREVLLTGDASLKREMEGLSKEASLSVDILKVSHHGSPTGNSLDFFRYINPLMALISAGKDNKFNHPNEDVLNNLINLSIPYFRTDELGSLYIVANNKQIKWKK